MALNFGNDGTELPRVRGRILGNTQALIDKRNLQPFDGKVSLTKEPCCVTFDDNPNECRARLSCGHAVGMLAKSPTNLILNQFFS